MAGKLLVDGEGRDIQFFAPTSGVVIPTSYTPTQDEVFKLAANATVTLDTIAITYNAGDIIGLAKGVTYAFTLATNAHKM